MAEDEAIVEQIDQLVAEQARLRDGDPSEDDVARINAIDTELNQCWDLLRQRRAREVAGADPDDAEIRGRSTPCLLYTSPSPRDGLLSRMPSSA